LLNVCLCVTLADVTNSSSSSSPDVMRSTNQFNVGDVWFMVRTRFISYVSQQAAWYAAQG
jgi:hypothetical protein